MNKIYRDFTGCTNGKRCSAPNEVKEQKEWKEFDDARIAARDCSLTVVDRLYDIYEDEWHKEIELSFFGTIFSSFDNIKANNKIHPTSCVDG